LVNKFGIKQTPKVLYDRATKKFKCLKMEDKHRLFQKLKLFKEGENPEQDKTLFT